MAPGRVFIGVAAKTTVTSSSDLSALKTNIKNSSTTGAYIDI